jgi:hypothetical protein
MEKMTLGESFFLGKPENERPELRCFYNVMVPLHSFDPLYKNCINTRFEGSGKREYFL